MNTRNSSVESLRIIATIMVILSHYCVHSMRYNEQIYTWISNPLNRYILMGSEVGGIAVILFFLITGYFQVEKSVK